MISSFHKDNYNFITPPSDQIVIGEQIIIGGSYKFEYLKEEEMKIDIDKEKEKKEIESLRTLIERSLKKLGTPLLESIEINYADKIGLYAVAILQCNARQALDFWMKILDEMQEFEIPILVEWTGDTDITPEEMGQYIGKALAKMKIFLVTEKPLDIIKIIEEEWGL